MRRAYLAVPVVAIALAAFAPSPLSAQRYGMQVSWGDDADIGLGARGVFGLPGSWQLPRLDAIASFDWFFPGGSVNYFEVNTNVAYRVPGVTGVAPYVGGGLNIAHSSNGTSNTNLGLNILGGMRFNIGPKLNALTEARIELSGGKQLVLTFGVLF